MKSFYPLRSGSFLCCFIASGYHWRVHICCELDDSWVCIWFGWSVAWVLNVCRQDLSSSWLGETTELLPPDVWGRPQKGAVGPPTWSPHAIVLEVHRKYWFQMEAGWALLQHPAPTCVRRQRRSGVRGLGNKWCWEMAAEARFQGLLASSALDSNHFTAFGHLGCGGF